MTNKEAISWIVGLIEHCGEDVPIYDEDVEALGMAIEVLEQEPCEDCISRAEVLKLLEKEDWADTVYGIMALPSVTPKPIIGRWIEVIDDTDSSGCKKKWHYKCSICGNEDSCWGEYNYCPICGAEMNGA